MYIIYGIAAIMVCCAIQFASTFILQMSVLDFEMALFIGIFFAASFVSDKMMKGLIKSDKKNTRARYFVCIASGVATFLGLYYMEFLAKSLLLKIGGRASMPYNLFGYIKYKLDFVDITFIARNGHRGSFPSAGTGNYIIFVLQILCSIFSAKVGCVRNHICYCDECRRYYKCNKLFSATQGDLGQIIKKGEIKIDTLKKLQDFMADHKVVKDKKKKYTGLFMYCPKCEKSKLVISNKAYDSKNEKEFREKVVDLDKTWTKELAGKDNNRFNF